MKHIALALAFASALLFTTTTDAQKFIPASDPDIAYMGRHVSTPEGNKAFNFPGFTAMLNFSGSSLAMATSPGSGYFMVEIDTLAPRKVHFGEADSLLALADRLPDGPHTARITYAIEGFEFKPELRGFYIGDDASLLPPPAKGKLKMEFIGNSITCGYGTEASGAEEHFSYDSENHCLSFSHLTARALDADVNIVSRSGIGIYRNYGGPREGSPEGTMPMEYGHALLYDAGQPWEFSRFQPDIICINLGTNDLSTQNYDISLYEAAYRKFLARVRQLNPQAKIVLLTGSMLNGDDLRQVCEVLDRVADGQAGVYRFDMTPMTGEYGYGADYHPSARQSEVMAEELLGFLLTNM